MGLKLSKEPFEYFTNYVTGRKRKRSEQEKNNELDMIMEATLRTPKRKKLTCTSKYIYQALFEEGQNSDVIVNSLGTQFRLHKLYLCQSPYFASMFKGDWLEASKNSVDIEVVDPLITKDSLSVVFGSLYNSEVELNPAQIVSILATATMFQLDGLIDKCHEVMVETINPKSAIAYYEAARQYGNNRLEDSCVKWFLVNLMPHYFKHPLRELGTIPPSLMSKLLNHTDLVVVQTEFSIYVMLKYWMYLWLNFDNCALFNEDESPKAQDMSDFYLTHSGSEPFLLTSMGQQFCDVFKGLRLCHLVSHQTDMDIITKDNIIPLLWLQPIFAYQWRILMRVNQGDDRGPVSVSESDFLTHSLRCGRIIEVKDRHMWRWTGFHFGIDLAMITDGNTVSIKRNYRPDLEELISLQLVRHVAIRVRVIKLDEERKIVYSHSSNIQHFGLSNHEEVQVVTFQKTLTYPIVVSVNLLFNIPLTDNT